MKTPEPQRKKKISNEASFRRGFSERLKHAAATHDIADLAAKVHVAPATLYRWLSGKFDPSLPKLAELGEAMNVSVGWLVTGMGPVDARRARRHALLEEYVATDFLSLAGEEQKSPLAFHEPWLFRLLYGTREEPTVFSATDMNPPLLVEVSDDSMEPTITKGELLLIDRSFGIRSAAHKQGEERGHSINDGLYAFQSRTLSDRRDHVIVRRLQYRLDAKVIVRCDNLKYPEEIYDLKDKPPKPVGRVVWRCGAIP